MGQHYKVAMSVGTCHDMTLGHKTTKKKSCIYAQMVTKWVEGVLVGCDRGHGWSYMGMPIWASPDIAHTPLFAGICDPYGFYMDMSIWATRRRAIQRSRLPDVGPPPATRRRAGVAGNRKPLEITNPRYIIYCILIMYAGIHVRYLE